MGVPSCKVAIDPLPAFFIVAITTITSLASLLALYIDGFSDLFITLVC